MVERMTVARETRGRFSPSAPTPTPLGGSHERVTLKKKRNLYKERKSKVFKNKTTPAII